MVDNDSIKAASESVAEVAKATQKALETTDKLGSFVAKFISSPLEQISGIITDKLKYYRWENQLALMERAQSILKRRGLENPDKIISLKIAIPLLENASMEDEPSLQQLWATLLVNFSDASQKIDQSMSFIELLKSLSPLEAKILMEIYKLQYDPIKPIITKELPDKAHHQNDNVKDETNFTLNENIEFALSNLDRLGCLTMAATWGGGRTPNQINQTLFGKKFVEACS